MRTAAQLAAVLTTVALSTACTSTVTGNEGNFRFSYVADEAFLDFNKPIAVGASLDVSVTAVGDDAPVVLSDARVADDTVLSATLAGGNVVTVTGLADGNTELEVKGAAAGQEDLSDSVNLRARVPDIHKLWHTCQNFNGVDASDYAYLAGQPVYIPFDFEVTVASGTEPVIGYGYYPVSSSSPEAVLDTTHQGSQYMRYELGGAGDVTLTSDIDGTTLPFKIITPAEIDGALQPIAFVLEDIDVGDRNPFYVLPSAAGRPVCQADITVEVASTSPSLCTVSLLADNAAGEASDAGKEYGWFQIEGLAAGMCTYTVTYPDGNAGAGATAEFSYEIQP